jgi:general stress protein CsbA
MINNLKKYQNHILTPLYVFDMVIIYVFMMFKINKGYFHIYFILMIIVGFLVGKVINEKLICKVLVKLKKKD